MPKNVRIQKALSDAGILSLRSAEAFIRQGRITVNGRRAEPGHPVDTAKDRIAIDGQAVSFPRRKENIYIMLNKPRGYVTTNNDELGRKCVAQLVEDVGARVYPVGRLDKDSEGLLLLTNDGQFANLIMHPSHQVGKTYRVTVPSDVNDEQAAHLAAGVDLGEGERSGPATVLVLEKSPGRTVLQITISEGKNREIRRMCEGAGLTVSRLKRISEGPLRLGMLQPGKWRELKKSEVIAIRNAARPAGQQEPMPRDDEPAEKTGSFGKPPAPKRGQTPARGRKPQDGYKPYGDKSGAKPYGDKSGAKPYSDKTSAKPYGNKAGAKPYGDKSGAKPYGDKSGAKPYGDKSGAKPYGDKSGAKPYGDKSGAKPYGDKAGAKPSGNYKPSQKSSREDSVSYGKSTRPVKRKKTDAYPKGNKK